LAHLDMAGMKAGARVAQDEYDKENVSDFALWKAWDEADGDVVWDAPWGRGRPGWHIECSAMSSEYLGETFDIHGGGPDLIFPHHENEIAQSEAASGQELARWWLHNGMVNVGGEKMSKSLGNFTTIRALLESGVSPMTLRLFVLQAHYRKPLDFTAAALEAAATGWKGLNAALGVGCTYAHLLPWSKSTAGDLAALPDDLAASKGRFIAAMDDDLNTAAAMGELFELARPLRALANRLQRRDIPGAADLLQGGRWRLLLELAGVLGLEPEQPRLPSLQGFRGDQATSGEPTTKAKPAASPVWKAPVVQSPTPVGISAEGSPGEDIRALIERRKAAKDVRDFLTADRIRDQLRARGIELIDRPDRATEWIQR